MRNEQLGMNNEQRTTIKNFITLLSVVCYLLFVSCDNISDPPEIHTPISYGKININFTEGEEAAHMARTVLPSTVFDKYVYTFTKTSETTGVALNPDNEWFFSLETGSYTVEVQAFIGDAEPYTLAAIGVSEQFNVGPGSNAPVVVILTRVNTEAQGELSYTITYPADAEAEIILQKWPGMNNITLTPHNVTEGNGITETLELETGSYVLTILVNKNGLYAGKNEAIHIYPSLATVYTRDYVDNDLLAATPITNAEISIPAPVKGALPGTTAAMAGDGAGNFTMGAVSWEPEDNLFQGGTVYTATVTLTAESRCTFTGLLSATINGQAATISHNTGAAVTLSHIFPATDTRTVTNIAIKTQPTELTYTHGDPLDLTGLVVTLTHDDNSTEDVSAADFTEKNITTNPVHGNHLIRSTHNGQPVTVIYGNLTQHTNNLTVNPKAITFVVDTIAAQTYTGSAHTPPITVRDDTTILTLTTDYTAVYTNNTNAGTATVTITGEGNYAGSTGSANFIINPKVVTLAVDSIPAQTYTGNAHTPTITVKDGTTILTPSTDYMAAYTNNTNAGTATVTITGAGNYAGSTGSRTFTISPKVITFAVDTIPVQAYTGSVHTPTVTVKDGTTILTLTTDYTAAYTNNTNAGTATVTISGAGNYAGSTGSRTFTINKATGATVNAPTLNTKTHNSITINAVTTPNSGQSVEYGISTSNNANNATWQTGLTFSGLNAGTTYYIFARTVGNNNYETGVASGSLTVTTSVIVTFSPDGGTPAPIQQTVDHGGKVTQPAAMTKTGYTFGGWFKESTLTNQWNFTTDIVTANTTLYAKWTPNIAGITFDMKQIIDGAPIIANITISRTNNGYPVTYNVSVNASDYDAVSITWKVAGVGAYAGQTVTGSGASFTLNAGEVKYNSLGGHALILTVAKGGQQYQRAIPFTIVH